jgi:hypothetical protein
VNVEQQYLGQGLSKRQRTADLRRLDRVLAAAKQIDDREAQDECVKATEESPSDRFGE